MMTPRTLCPALLAACLVLITGCGTAPTPAETYERGDRDSAYGVGVPAQLFDDMGEYTRPITTDSRQAQRYFDQGLKWMYAFNNDEAVRSFTKAAELDPGCAMAWWGVAHTQGPYYNSSRMNEAREQAAWAATQKALAQLDDETPVEQALVRALTRRYDDPALPEDDKARQKDSDPPDAQARDADAEDTATQRSSAERKADYARVMARLYNAYPDDPDVGALYANAMMVMHPWRLWEEDGSPRREQSETIVQTLDAVLDKHPEHPGANHLYIHAVEASADKMRGIPAADRLSTQVPMSGHLTHMPSHLYVQVGMWNRAVEQNLLAMRADEKYLSKSPMQFRQHGYMAHNGHMLAFAGMMVGREAEALAGAEAVWQIPDEIFDTMGRRYDRAMCAKYDVLRRFGRWDRLLAEPAPPKVLRQTTAVWRACRAVAFAAKKDFVNARAEHAAFKVYLEDRPNDRFLKLNDRFVAAEIALQQEKWDEAVALLEEAIQYEDQMLYSEPPRWVQPVRHTLGAVLVKAERFAEAERVYRADLEQWPGNGWSLLGLTRALEGQDKRDAAAKTRAKFEQAWANADNPLTTSCECLPDL